MRDHLALMLFLAIAAAAPSALADARKAQTKDAAELVSRPGEQARVLIKLKAGQAVRVLDQEGRWIKVRVKGRTGWLPRTKLSGLDPEVTERNTRRRPFVDGRSTNRGWSGSASAPNDRVGSDASDAEVPPENEADDDQGEEADPKKRTADQDPARDRKKRATDASDRTGDHDREAQDEPDPVARPLVAVTAKTAELRAKPDRNATSVVTLKRDAELYVEREANGWLLVETDEGDEGWIRESSVRRVTDPGPQGPSQDRGFRAGAHLGLKLIAQKLATAGGNAGVPDNYTINSSAAALSLGGSWTRPVGSRYWIDLEGSYAGAKIIPGIAFMGVKTGVMTHEFEVRANLGYDLKGSRGTVLWGRLGYHYENYSVSGVSDPAQNPAKIPSEVFHGPTLGFAMDMPRITSRISLRAALDTIFFATKRSQTVNLEDGTSPASKGAWLTAAARYRLGQKYSVDAVYRLTYLSTDFGPPDLDSTRGHTGTGSKRTELNHMIALGASRRF